MSSVDMGKSFVIHLGLGDAALSRAERDARSRGMSVIQLDLACLTDRASLVGHLATAFMFPYEVDGLDAAIDLISDLEWLGNGNGYLVVARGSAASPRVAGMFVSILPNILDRWRSQAVPFVFALEAKDTQLQAALQAANREMDKAGGLPWAQPGTGSVDVIVHQPEPRNEDLGMH